MHPDFGGDAGPVQIYGFPYIVVDSAVPLRAVQFQYDRESDGVNHATRTSFPFYPIPDEAITQAHWIESGEPGNVDLRSSSDRHMLIVDKDRRYLFELYNVFYDGAQWRAGSGAFFDLSTNNRRPDTWTSADAAGLAILPGLIRAGNERLRLSRISPGGLHAWRTSNGRQASTEGQPGHLGIQA